jgi:hypothetical protein
MRVYGGSDDETVMNLQQYHKEVASKRMPAMIEQITKIMSGQALGVSAVNAHHISVEHVQAVAAKSYWKIAFQSAGLIFEYSCFARPDKSIYGSRSLLVRSTMTQRTTRYEFKGATHAVSNVSTYQESDDKYRDLGQSSPYQATPMVPTITLEFVSGGYFKWICSACRKLKAPWCVHIQAYLDGKRDAAHLANVDVKKLGRPAIIKYPLPGGHYLIDLKLELITAEAMGFDEGDDMKRLSYDNNLSLWMEPDTSGMQLVDQLFDIVRSSDLMEIWTERSRNFMKRGESCCNRFHDPRDTRAFNDAIKALRDEDGDTWELDHPAVDRYAFANAFTEYYEHRCMACMTVLQRMGGDAPKDLNQPGGGTNSSLSGTPTLQQPF